MPLGAPRGLFEPEGAPPEETIRSKRRQKRRIHVPTEQEDEARSLDEGQEGSLGSSPRAAVEKTLQDKYVEVAITLKKPYTRGIPDVFPPKGGPRPPKRLASLGRGPGRLSRSPVVSSQGLRNGSLGFGFTG